MRNLLRVTFLVASVAALSTTALATSAVGGVAQLLEAPLTIVKTVSGPVPAGTTFTVNVHCPDGNIDTGDNEDTTATALTDTDADVTFDATGQPTSPDIIGFVNEGTCTVSETQSGGASSVDYSCVGDIPVNEEVPIPTPESSDGFHAAAEEITDPCDGAGPQAAPMTVFIVDSDQEATVTVHNTFAEPAPTPAAQIVAQPAFTG